MNQLFFVETGQRIKILFITKWFMNRHDPQIGVFIRKHASAAALHNDVALLCVLSDATQHNLIEIEEQKIGNIQTWVVYHRKFNSPLMPLNTVINFSRYLRANRKGLKAIRKKFGRHDITHAYILLRPLFIAWWMKMTKGIPIVVSEQWSGYATGKFSEKNFFVKFISRWLFRQAGAATVVSEFLKTKMVAAGMENNYTVTPNIAEPSAKKTSPLSSNGKIKIITVADLVDEIKNISGTIKAIAKIAATNKEIEFHIIGHGKDELLLKNLAKEYGLLDSTIFFHGVKPNEEVFQFLYASNFLVMNSWFETFSLICIEAMSCGIPVIATRCGGPEQFINRDTGILIEPGDAEQLRIAIETMISTFMKYDSKRLADFANSQFSMKGVGEKFDEIYRNLLNR
ncbi:MAG: glycosyltransferase [Bacteroidota bacterium]